MTRPTISEAQVRESMEGAILELVLALPALSEVALRCKQARRRAPVTADVLDPAALRLAEVDQGVRVALGQLRAVLPIILAHAIAPAVGGMQQQKERTYSPTPTPGDAPVENTGHGA